MQNQSADRLLAPSFLAAPARRGLRMLLLSLVVALLVPSAPSAQDATAPAPREGRRVVGLVFDDSGSMKNRIQLPAFAAQLLVSSLDPARDRLFTLRLSTWIASARDGEVGRLLGRGGIVDPGVTARLRAAGVADLPRDEFALAGPAAIVERIRSEWPVARSDTPFGPIEMMLETLAAEAVTGDVVHLVVLTDGKFEPEPPDLVRLRRDFEQYRARLRAPLHVDFVLIAPAGAEGDAVRADVERQGVRRMLATVFEGEPERRCGAVACNDVSNSRDLYRVVFDVIARVNETDRGGTPRGAAVRVDDRRLTVESPLSVSRIVGVTFAPAGEKPPALAGNSFGAPPTLSLESSMKDADTAAGWRDERNSARSVQFTFPDTLPPGTHALDFDRSLGDRHLFLFDTAAKFRLEPRDARGNPLPLGADGTPEVVKGQGVSLAATVVDRLAGRDVAVDWPRLDRARLEAFVDPPGGGRTAVPIGPDVVAGARVGVFTPAKLGLHAVGGSLTLDGFVRKEARRPVFRVIDAAVAPRVAIRAVECPTCGPGELRTRLVPNTPTAVVGEVDVTVPGDRPAPVAVSLVGSPPWLSLIDRDGAVVTPDRALLGDDRGRIVLRLVRAIETPDEPADHVRPLTLRVAALAPWTGEASATATLRVEVPIARLEHVGDTDGGGPDATLVLDRADLAAGGAGARFRLTGAPGLAVRAEDFSVATRSTWVDWRVEVAGRDIVVRPVERWCRCGTWFFGIPREMELVFAGFGETRATATLSYEPTWEERLRLHLYCIGPILVLIWFVPALAAYARAPRFPRASHAEIRRRHQPISASEPLRRWDREGNWRCLRWAAIWCARPARHAVEGLHLEASYAGFRLLWEGTDENIKVEGPGRTVRSLKEDARGQEALPLAWESAFSDRRMFERLVVRRGLARSS